MIRHDPRRLPPAPRPGFRTTAVLGLCFLAACGESTDTTTLTVRDSAGVRIVEHGPLADRTAFEIGEPRFRVGWVRGGHQFQSIVSGALLEDGGAAVGDIGSDEVVYVSAEGEVESVVGGSGEGPTEIGTLMRVHRLSGDTVLVDDQGNGRFSVFHRGGLVRSHRKPGRADVFGLAILGRLGESFALTTTGYRPDVEEPWVVAPLVHHVLDSERWDTIAIYDRAPSFDFSEVNNPMMPYGSAALADGELLVVRGDRSEVRRLDATGRLVQIVRWDPKDQMLTDSLWNVYADGVRARMDAEPEEVERWLEERRERVVEPLPPVGELFGDADGNAWVTEYPLAFPDLRAYRVFDADGAWLGWVQMPPRTEILDIGTDRILAIQRDPFDVEAVTILPILR